MSNLNKYEEYYQASADVCGAPFQEMVAFFETYTTNPARVLDLGCGQGRDALFIARKGHNVLGVDASKTGIAQILEKAQEENLNVEGVVADIVAFKPKGEYDVVLLDRVLHMLKDPETRQAVLETVCSHVAENGYVLLADEKKNIGQFQAFFKTVFPSWETILHNKGFLFMQRKGLSMP